MAEEEEEVGASGDDWFESLASSETSDVELMQQVWRNEKLAPEILAYQGELVQRIKEQISLAEENLMVDSQDNADELILSLYRMDLDRALFLLRSYLRSRLDKIEKFALHISSDPEVWGRLSEQEQDYTKSYVDALQAHMHESLLKNLPEEYRSLTKQAPSSQENDMIVEPSLNTFVFCKCKSNLNGFQLDDKGDQLVDMENGDLYILNYRPVRRLLEMDKIELC